MIIEGIVRNNTQNGDINDGQWGIEVENDFIECGNFLGELDILLTNQNEKETKQGTKIKITIE